MKMPTIADGIESKTLYLYNGIITWHPGWKRVLYYIAPCSCRIKAIHNYVGASWGRHDCCLG